MNSVQTTLTHHPLLPFALARTISPETVRPFVRKERPASLWRNSLAADAEGLAGVETWVFLTLTALVLPALAINQSVLWHLLDHGTLSRVIHAFLLAGG